jgi:hypothetical protein
MEALEYEQELQRCRETLAAELDVEDVPDDVWGYVMKLLLPYEAITGSDAESWQVLVDKARDYMQDSQERIETYIPSVGRGADRETPDQVALHPSEDATKKAEALTEVFATLAENHPEVDRFRRSYLPGWPLTDEQAREFLSVRGGPKGTDKAVLRSAPNPKWALHPAAKRYSTPTDMRELLGLASKLSNAYGWQEGDALWFVLTGYIPPLRPLEVEMLIHMSTGPSRYYSPITARITVTAQAWVQADEVASAFRDAQRQLLRSDAPPTARDERTLEVVKFVARRMRKYEGETWSKRWKAWNRTCSKRWRYSDYRGFQQVYERFKKRYVYRKYEPPNYVKRERTPFEAYRDQWNERFTRRKGKHAG